jgi:hypothetical protein
MKTLTLICICGKSRTFEGRNVDEILRQIDDSGWVDYPNDKKPLPSGEQHGYCPECMRKL